MSYRLFRASNISFGYQKANFEIEENSAFSYLVFVVFEQTRKVISASELAEDRSEFL